MAKALQISPFSSLNFDNNWRLGFQAPVDYVQKFAPTDPIRVQFSKTDGIDVEVRLIDRQSGEYEVVPQIQFVTGYESVYEVRFNAGDAGAYTLQFAEGEHIHAYSDFCVTTDTEELLTFVYTNRRNDFQTIFPPDSVFVFRAEGVFLPSENQYLVEAEGFRDQRYTYHQLSALPYKKRVLTIGNRFGVPTWVAEKINIILSLSNVWIDSQPIVRGEGSSPEVAVLHPDYPLFAYKVEIEEDMYADENPPERGDFNEDFNNDFSIGIYG